SRAAPAATARPPAPAPMTAMSQSIRSLMAAVRLIRPASVCVCWRLTTPEKTSPPEVSRQSAFRRKGWIVRWRYRMVSPDRTPEFLDENRFRASPTLFLPQSGRNGGELLRHDCKCRFSDLMLRGRKVFEAIT